MEHKTIIHQDNNNEINDSTKALMDIYKQLGSIDAKLGGLPAISQQAERADQRATEALHRVKANENNVQSLKGSVRWITATGITVIMPLVIFVLNQVFG